MQITLETSGGFAPTPRLSAPVQVDTERLDPMTASELRDLVEAAKFFDQPEDQVAPAPGSADLMTYAITIRDGARQHTIRVVDPVGDPRIQQLIDRLRGIAPDN